MAYKTLTIEYGTRNGKKFCRINYTGETFDKMGKWKSSGILADVHSVDGHLVLVYPLNQTPFMVCTDIVHLKKRLHEKYGIDPLITKV